MPSAPLPRRHVLASAISVAIASSPLPARAQTPADDYVLPVITVEEEAGQYKSDRISSPLHTAPPVDTPQTMHIIPSEVIKDREATSLRDVLRNVPGISIQAGEGGTPPGDQMTIRGFSARTDIFIDGVRDFGGYSRDPFNLEQVEVAKGPAGAYTGRGSTGGSINLVSKLPTLEDFAAGSLSAGTDEYQRTTVDLNRQVGESTAVRLNLMQHEQDVAGRDEVYAHRDGFAPSIAFGLDTDTRLFLSYLHMSQDNMPDYGLPWVPNTNTALPGHHDKVAPVDYNNFYGLKDRDFETIENDIASVLFEKDLNDALTLRNLTRYGRTHRDFIATAPRFASTGSTLIGRHDHKSRNQLDEVYANRTDLTFRFTTGNVGHTLVTGVELVHEDEVNRLRDAANATVDPADPADPGSDPTDLFNPDPNDPYTDGLYFTGEKNVARAYTKAVFIGDTLELNDRWQVNLGARFDDFRVVYEPAGGKRLTQDDDLFSWRAGVVYKPAPNGSLYAGYGVSFNPSAEGLTLSNATGNRPGTFGLDPEESRSLEVGTKWELANDRLLLNAALFRTEKVNALTQDPADPNDYNVLEGEQRVEGVELGATGAITERWQVFAGYTWMTSEIEKSKNPAEVGKDVSNTPEHTFTLWSVWRPVDRFEFGVGALYVDDRFSNNTNTRMAPDYWVYDAMASWYLDDNFAVRLNVKNLTDEDYIDQVGGGHAVPGEGRVAIASLDFRF